LGWDFFKFTYIALILPIKLGACQGAALATEQMEIAETVMGYQHPWGQGQELPLIYLR